MDAPRPALDRGSAAIGLVVVLVANGLYLAGLPRLLDPLPAMDPFYIAMARRSLVAILREGPAWGPLYAVWLKPFVAIAHDPMTAYLANVYAMSITVSVLMFVVVLLWSGRTSVAVGAALLFLVSDMNVPLDSRVNSFALVPLLSGMIASALLTPGGGRTAACAAGALLASCARPELWPAAVGMSLATMRRGLWRDPVRAAIGVLAVALPAVWFGRSSGRSLVAFQVYFATNWTRWHHQWQDFVSIWEGEFGAAHSVWGAAMANPLAVARHVADNVVGTLVFLARGAGGHHPLLVPATWPAATQVENVLVSTAMLGILVTAGARRTWRRRVLDRHGEVVLLSGAVAACSIVAAAVVFPSPRYLAIAAVLLMLNTALASAALVPAGPPWSPARRALAALACLIAVPRPFVLPTDYLGGAQFTGRIAVARTLTDTVQFIRALGLPPPVSVLTETDGVGEMLGDGFREVKLWEKGRQPLEAYMRDQDVGVIVDLRGGRDTFAGNDPYWSRIQVDPDDAGFTRVHVPDHERVGVYVRKDLLSKRGRSGA